MKTMISFQKPASVFAIIMAATITYSCQENNEKPFSQEALFAVEEAATDAYFEDADDLSNVAISNASEAGRIAAQLEDDRLCAEVQLTLSEESTLEYPIGNLTINFGNGCTDPRGNTRKGTINIYFEGRRFMPESFMVITFNAYSINGVSLKGTRTLTNVSGSTEESPKFRVELNGSASWPDGTNATRKHCFIREWVRAESPINDELIITQCPEAEIAAEGKNRRGIEYTMVIEEQLVYKRGCPIAVSGQKLFTNVATGQQMQIDYGTDMCNTIIITIDGVSTTVKVTKQ
jgi:hypothetical protein